MTKLLFSFLCLLLTISFSSEMLADNPENPKGASANIVKLKELKKEKENLSRQIKIEDAKRNKQIPGVNKETLELMNDRQDSICLALRSRLVDVNLEIKELTPANIPSGLINQYNNMVNGNKPSKPNKKK